MCKFFSFISDGNANFYYFNDEQRKKIIKKELKKENWIVENPDSHSSIARFYFQNREEDSMNKYEFNPITSLFEIDQINTNDDSILAKDFAMSLDFRSIVPELNIQKIENPLDQECVYVDTYHILLLQKWASVRDSVRDSVGASVRDSVRDSVGASVWDSVGASVWDSVWASVKASVRDSVWDSAWASVSSYFALEKRQWKYCDGVNFEGCDNPFQSCIDLWSLGLVPSFDGTTWRLHAGKDAKIIFSISKNDLEKYGE